MVGRVSRRDLGVIKKAWEISQDPVIVRFCVRPANERTTCRTSVGGKVADLSSFFPGAGAPCTGNVYCAKMVLEFRSTLKLSRTLGPESSAAPTCDN